MQKGHKNGLEDTSKMESLRGRKAGGVRYGNTLSVVRILWHCAFMRTVVKTLTAFHIFKFQSYNYKGEVL